MSKQQASSFDIALGKSIKSLGDSRRAVVFPARTPAHEGSFDLTIGIATYDDFDGLFFTLHSLMLHHAEVMPRVEIIILDNHPEGIEAHDLEHYSYLHAKGVNVRYVPYTEVRSTAVRDVIFRLASADAVLVLDSHVLLAPGALEALLKYYDEHPDSMDLIQGPMLSGNATHIAATHMIPGFQKGMYGHWGVDPRGKDPTGEPFEIELHGLGIFSARKAAWPGLHPDFIGFGGEEGYIHEKFRLNGGKVICLPALRWVHRFERPRGVPYRIRWEDRLHNYLVGWKEIGYDLNVVRDHFSDLLGSAYPEVEHLALSRIQRPERDFSGICVVSDANRLGPWRSLLAESEKEDITVRRQAVILDENHSSGVLRRQDPASENDSRFLMGIVDSVTYAVERGWDSVLVLDERAILDDVMLFRVAGKAKQNTGDIIVFGGLGEPANDELLCGPVLVRSSAYERVLELASERKSGVLDTIEVAASCGLDDWAESVGGTVVQTQPPIARSRSVERAELRALIDCGYVINLDLDRKRWQDTYQSFARMGLGREIHRLRAVHDSRGAEWGFARSWRRAIELIPDDASRPILLSQDDAILLRNFEAVFKMILIEAQHVDWQILSLSSGVVGSIEDPATHANPVVEPVAGSTLLQRKIVGNGDTFVVVHPGARDKLLSLIPDHAKDPEEFSRWLRKHGSIAGFLDSLVENDQLRALSSSPVLATTRERLLLDSPESQLSTRFNMIE